MKMYKRLCKNITIKYGKAEASTYIDTKEFEERLGFKEIGRAKYVNFLYRIYKSPKENKKEVLRRSSCSRILPIDYKDKV